MFIPSICPFYIAEITTAVGSFLSNKGYVTLGAVTTFVAVEVRTVDDYVEAHTVGDWVRVLIDGLVT